MNNTHCSYSSWLLKLYCNWIGCSMCKFNYQHSLEHLYIVKHSQIVTRNYRKVMWSDTNQCLKASKTHGFLRSNIALSQTVTDCNLAHFPPKEIRKTSAGFPLKVSSCYMKNSCICFMLWLKSKLRIRRFGQSKSFDCWLLADT